MVGSSWLPVSFGLIDFAARRAKSAELASLLCAFVGLREQFSGCTLIKRRADWGQWRAASEAKDATSSSGHFTRLAADKTNKPTAQPSAGKATARPSLSLCAGHKARSTKQANQLKAEPEPEPEHKPEPKPKPKATRTDNQDLIELLKAIIVNGRHLAF